MASAFPSYAVHVQMKHSVFVGEPIAEEELVISYKGSIVTVTASGDDPEVGSISFHVVKLGTALDSGRNGFEVCDAHSADLAEYGASLLDPKTGQLRDDLVKRFEIPGSELMIIDGIEIDADHRGQDLGLLVLDRVIDLYGGGVVACWPRPADVDTPDREVGTRKLQWHAQRLGFVPVTENGVYALSASLRRPKVQLRARS